MTCTVCPNCGLDLERFAPVLKGDLELQAHEIRWKGKPVRLRPSGRMLVSAIVRADGVPVSRQALMEVLGCEDAQNPENLISVQICHVRRAFSEIDPTFAALESIHSTGMRWAA
jgi:DNA-binding response OmpR family regulator